MRSTRSDLTSISYEIDQDGDEMDYQAAVKILRIQYIQYIQYHLTSDVIVQSSDLLIQLAVLLLLREVPLEVAQVLSAASQLISQCLVFLLKSADKTHERTVQIELIAMLFLFRQPLHRANDRLFLCTQLLLLS